MLANVDTFHPAGTMNVLPSGSAHGVSVATTCSATAAAGGVSGAAAAVGAAVEGAVEVVGDDVTAGGFGVEAQAVSSAAHRSFRMAEH
jgi:hypothetical protein